MFHCSPEKIDDYHCYITRNVDDSFITFWSKFFYFVLYLITPESWRKFRIHYKSFLIELEEWAFSIHLYNCNNWDWLKNTNETEKFIVDHAQLIKSSWFHDVTDCACCPRSWKMSSSNIAYVCNFFFNFAYLS
jgi:hypothetical protein